MMMKSKSSSSARAKAAFIAFAAFAASPVAMAALVCHSPDLSVPDDLEGVYLNLVTGESGTTGALGWDINPYNNNAGLTFFGAASPSGVLATGTPGTLAEAVVLVPGDTVSPTPAPNIYNPSQTRGTGFQTAGTRFVGIKFLNEGTAAANYAWLEVVSGVTNGFPATISRYCYDNTGAAITLGCTFAASYGSVTVNLDGTVTSISSCSFAGEYSTINGAVDGQTLRVASSVTTDYISIHSGSPDGPVVAFGPTPLTFANPYSGTLYAHWSADATCGTQTACRVTTVQCTICAGDDVIFRNGFE